MVWYQYSCKRLVRWGFTVAHADVETYHIIVVVSSCVASRQREDAGADVTEEICRLGSDLALYLVKRRKGRG
jgi:hypothetical protein